MSTFETLQDPAVSFSSSFLNITCSPAGLAYTFSPAISSFFKLLFSLFWPAIFVNTVASITFHLHHRLKVLEMVFSRPMYPISLDHFNRLLAIVQRILLALSTIQTTTQEALETLSKDLRALISSLDADIATLDETFTPQLRLHLGVLTSLEQNLDQARILLGAGVEVDGSEAGLDVGDDMQTFWPEDEANSEPGDDDEVDEPTDVEASDELVFGWLGRIADPDECWDDWEWKLYSD